MQARTPALTFLLGITLLLSAPCSPQTPVPPPPENQTEQLSPQAAYQDALHPLEVTRHNIANWSDVEIAAMTVAVGKAKTACAARKPTDYTGTALVDLARLCALGQQWPAVVEASSRYIAAADIPSKPLLTDAYTAQTEAYLHLHQDAPALASALAMLSAVPYSPEVADCIDETLNYLRFLNTSEAVKLAQTRQPLVLAALHASTPANPDPALPDKSSEAHLAIHELYANGLTLAALQQLAAMPADAKATVLALDAAAPAVLPSDDALRIAQHRRQYALLGQPLSGIKPLTSLSSPANKLPDIPAHNTITALLLFPDWCALCVRLTPQLPETAFKVEGHSAYIYALLAQTVPPRKPDPKLTNAGFNPASAAAMLSETPTVTVAPDTLDHFEAADFPLLLLTDAAGILRVMQPVSAQDLQPGGDLDAAIALVGRNFSHTLPPSPPPPGTRPTTP